MATFQDTFETGDLSNWPYYGGDVSVETDIVKNGSYALKCMSSYEGNGFVSAPRILNTSTDSYMRRVSFWLYIEEWNRNFGLLEIMGRGARNSVSPFYTHGRYAIPLWITSDRYLRISAGTNDNFLPAPGWMRGSTQLAVGEWNRISLSYRSTNDGGGFYHSKKCKVYINGVEELYCSFYNYTQFGPVVNIGCFSPCWSVGESVILRFDDIHYDDTESHEDLGDIP